MISDPALPCQSLKISQNIEILFAHVLELTWQIMSWKLKLYVFDLQR